MSLLEVYEIQKFVRRPMKILLLDEVVSTNTIAIKMLADGKLAPKIGEPDILITRRQSGGRGRIGRKWFSADDIDGASLSMSVVVAVNPSACGIAAFTVRAGLGICRSLAAAFGSHIFLKWPNDIYDAADRKLAGMLAEMLPSPDGKTPHYIVFGVGLNCDFSKVELPSEIRGIAADLNSASFRKVSISQSAAIIAESVAQIADFYNSGASDSFESDYSRFDALAGRRIDAEISSRKISGKACGIASGGELKILLDNGETELLNSGEAVLNKSFRKNFPKL